MSALKNLEVITRATKIFPPEKRTEEQKNKQQIIPYPFLMKLTPSYPLSRLKRNLREFETLNGGRRSVACRRFLNRVIVSRNLLQGGETCEEQFDACLAERQNKYSEEEEFSEEVVTKQEYPLYQSEVDPAWADPKKLKYFGVASQLYAEYTKAFIETHFQFLFQGSTYFKETFQYHAKGFLGRILSVPFLWKVGIRGKKTDVDIKAIDAAYNHIKNVRVLANSDPKLGEKLLEMNLKFLDLDINDIRRNPKYENIATEFASDLEYL